jgi:RNA polymerase sigma-70 factor (ECF subfamily)
MNPVIENAGQCVSSDFEALVNRFYVMLYRFSLALTRSEADACDLTQQTFSVWAEKGNQLRDGSKVKYWLFTTLPRAFLAGRRRQVRLPHFELSEADAELPPVPPPALDRTDAKQVLEALQQVNEVFQAPIALFYLDDCPYKDIAERLGVPLGTVKSRIARGLAQLQQIMGGTHGSKRRGEAAWHESPSRPRAATALCEVALRVSAPCQRRD